MMLKTTSAWLLAVATLAGEFGAPEFTAGEREDLARGEPVVRVERDRRADDGAAAVFGAVDIRAERKTIWNIMLDCGRAPEIVSNLKSCAVVESAPDGAYDVREHVISYTLLFPRVRSVFRSEYTPYEEIRFEKAGGDLRVLEGVWRLAPAGDGERVRVIYQARLAIAAPVPRAIMRANVRGDMRDILRALRETAERDAAG